MSFPDDQLPLTAEILIGSTWVDVTSRLRTEVLSIDHGTNTGEATEAVPATTAVELENPDGWLSSDNPDSPWWPYIDQGTEVRFAEDGDVLLHGKIIELSADFPEGDLSDGDEAGEAYAHVEVAGILHELNESRQPLRSPLYRLATNADHIDHISDYFPMEDGVGADFLASGLPDNTGRMTSQGLALASDEALLGSEALPFISAGKDGSWFAQVTGVADEWCLEMFVHIPEPPDDTATLIRWDVNTADGSHVKWTITIGYDGTQPFVRLRSFAPSGAIDIDYLDTTVEHLFGPDPSVIRLHVIQDGADIDWSLNWATVTAGIDPADGSGGTEPGTAGRPSTIRCEVAHAPPGGFANGHVFIHDGLPGGWLIPADIGHLGESALARLIRLCDEEGYALGWTVRDNIAETTAMGVQRALPFLELVEECRDSDGGILCELRTAYGLRYQTRRSLMNKAVAWTLSARDGEIIPPLTPVLDRMRARNVVVVERIDGTKHETIDPLTSQPPPAGIGRRPISYSLSLASDAVVPDHAGWRLHLLTTPYDKTRIGQRQRVAQLTVDLAIAPHLLAAWRARRVGDRIKVVDLPPQFPTWPGFLDLLIIGWNERPGPDSKTVTINCIAAGPWNVAVWNVSRYSPVGCALIDSVNALAASLEVTQPGQPWIDSGGYPGQFPFDIQVGPEVMTVTAITGTASPQTMTVTRNVNSYGRGHPAGATVALAEPAYLAL